MNATMKTPRFQEEDGSEKPGSVPDEKTSKQKRWKKTSDRSMTATKPFRNRPDRIWIRHHSAQE